MQTLKAGALYFAFVFGAGFALGTIRILWVVPLLGTRVAELMEAPFMLTITIASARWVIRRLAVRPAPSSRLGMGVIALGLLLAVEFTLVLWLRGLSMREYFANRDPVSEQSTTSCSGCFPPCRSSWPGKLKFVNMTVMSRDFICLMCPNGCHVTIAVQDDQLVELQGNLCDKGVDFARAVLDSVNVNTPIREISATCSDDKLKEIAALWGISLIAVCPG